MDIESLNYRVVVVRFYYLYFKMALRLLGFSSAFAVAHVLFFYMTYITHFHCGMAQRNPPPGAVPASSTNGEVSYTYGRGDIPMLHPEGLQQMLIAELRKLIIAIRYVHINVLFFS